MPRPFLLLEATTGINDTHPLKKTLMGSQLRLKNVSLII